MKIVFDFEGSYDVAKWMIDNSDLIVYTYDNMKECINQLIKIQHKMIDVLDHSDKYYKTLIPDMKGSFMNTMCTLFRDLKSPKFINRYDLWKIPKKDTTDDSKNLDIFLSASDEEKEKTQK